MNHISVFWADLKDSSRTLWKQPGWSALLVLVLCAGMTSLLFVTAVTNALILRPLPFPEPAQLFIVGPSEGLDQEVQQVAERDYWALRNQVSKTPAAASIEIAGTSEGTMYLNFGTQTERFNGAFITPNLMQVTGTNPLLGPGFQASDATPGAAIKLAISHKIWQQYFLGDPGVVGRQVRMNGQSAEIVAVMPKQFTYPRNSELWSVSTAGATPLGAREDDRYLQMLARVSDPAALPVLNTALSIWKQQLDKVQPEILGTNSVVMAKTVRNQIINTETRTLVAMMMIATLLILMLACLNAASLMLSIKLGRTHELAVRQALGASRLRIARHLFADSLILVVISTVISTLLAQWLVRAMVESMRKGDDGGPPLWMSFDLDASSVVLAIFVGFLTALAAGLWPALKLSSQASTALRSGNRSSASGIGKKFSGTMIALELACAAGLLIGSLHLASYVSHSFGFNLGVRTENRMTARIGLFDSQYPTADSRLALYDEILRRVRADSQVINATLSSGLPGLNGDNRDMLPAGSAAPVFENVGINVVDLGFQSTMQSRLVDGRWFNAADNRDGVQVTVVDEKFVAQYSPDASPIGKRFVLAPQSASERTVSVIGVVEALTMEDASDNPEPVMLVPLSQETPRFISLIVHHRGDAGALQQKLIANMRALDADTPLYWLRSYEAVIHDANVDEAVLAWMFNAFSLIAILLAVSGLFGLVAFNVNQRTRELGLRKAIGATDVTLVRGLMSHSLIQIGAGLLLGGLLGMPFANFLLTTIDEKAVLDPMIALAVFVGLALAAILAALIPACRALRISPIMALRQPG